MVPATLHCGDMVSNASFQFMYDNGNGAKADQVASKKPINITVTEATKAGMYICQYDGVVNATYIVGNYTKPSFVNARTSVTYNAGDLNRKLTCVSDSYPAPMFTWSTRGTEEGAVEAEVTPEANPTYEITSNGTQSILKFHNVSYDDAQTFICKASNFVNNETAELLVRVKSRYAAVWPFLGIVIEVVILIIVIFIYEKRSKKVNEDKAVFTPSEDEKPLNRDEGVEMRNRHGNK